VVFGVAERDSWATMNGATRVVDAEDARLGIGALWTPGTTALRSRQGIRLGPGNPGKVTASATPDVNIHVAKFQAVLTASRGLGEYIATLDADKTIDILTGQPAHATLVRNDLIIGRQQDTYYVDGSTSFLVQRILGIAGAGDPSLAAIPDYILLARVRVAALATTITTAMIDDLRPGWAVALGGLLPVNTQTERDALTAFDGLAVYRVDRDWIEVYRGGWRVQSTAVCSSTADRDSAITHPYNGQLAVTTDTDQLWHYDAAIPQWRYAVPGTVVGGKRRITNAATTSAGAELEVDNTGALPLIGNSQFEARLSLNWDASVAGDNFITRIRKTNSSGSILQQQVVPGVGASGVPAGWTMSIPYITSTPETETFVATISRLAGSGTATVTPGSFIEVIYKGPSSMYGTL